MEASILTQARNQSNLNPTGNSGFDQINTSQSLRDYFSPRMNTNHGEYFENSSTLPWQFLCRPIHYDYAFVMYGVLCPLLGVMTLVGNLIAIGIFTMNRRMRSPTSILLIGLAVSDILAATVITPMYIYFYSLDKSKHFITFPLCIYHSYAYKIAVLFHTTSVWLTTALGVQRCIVVAFPLPGRQICTHRNSSIVVLLIYLTACIVYSPWFISDRFESYTFIDEHGASIQSCLCTKADIVILSHEKLYKTIRLMLGQLLPCAVLVFTTAVLVRKLKIQTNRIIRLHADHDDDGGRREFRHIRRTTVMVVLIVVCFLCVEIPLGVVLLLDLGDATFIQIDAKKKMAVFLNFFTYINYHVNFWIYVCLSKNFRQSLRKILKLETIFEKCVKKTKSLPISLDIDDKSRLSTYEHRMDTKLSFV